MARAENGAGHLNDKGYLVLKVNGRQVKAHRLALEEHLGRPLLAHETVHHKDGDRSNNAISNLELRIGAHGKGASEKHCSTCTCFMH